MDNDLSLVTVGCSLPVAPPCGLEVHGRLCPLQSPPDTVGSPAGLMAEQKRRSEATCEPPLYPSDGPTQYLDGGCCPPHLQEVPAFQHHPKPALQEQDLSHNFPVQRLLQCLSLCLLQENLVGTGTGGIREAPRTLESRRSAQPPWE